MNPLRVLVVDDSELDREQICVLFGEVEAPLRVSTVATACEGLDVLQRESFDCALLDFRLPDGNAFWILDELARANRPAPPALVISGAGNARIAEESLRRGALGFLAKDDLTAAELFGAVEGAISSRGPRRERPVEGGSPHSLDFDSLESIDPADALRFSLSEVADALIESEALRVDPMPPVFASAPLVGNLFAALIEQSLRYRDDAPVEIHIRGERYGEEVVFTVDDNGVRYRNAHLLAEPIRLARLHGGELWAEARANGHRVRFTLPAADRPPLQ